MLAGPLAEIRRSSALALRFLFKSPFVKYACVLSIDSFISKSKSEIYSKACPEAVLA